MEAERIGEYYSVHPISICRSDSCYIYDLDEVSVTYSSFTCIFMFVVNRPYIFDLPIQLYQLKLHESDELYRYPPYIAVWLIWQLMFKRSFFVCVSDSQYL